MINSLIHRVFLVAAVLLTLSGSLQAAGIFIPASNRVDMVHDAARNIVYISGGSSVLRYQLASGTYLPPFQTGGNLKGIDLSPDGNTLVVADKTSSATHVWVHVINLVTETISLASFPKAFMEDGLYAVAFGNDGAVLITSTFAGSGWVPLRRYVPSTGAVSVIGSIRQNSMVAANAAGNFMAVAEANISSGPVSRYNVLTQKLEKTGGTGWFNYEVGISRDATQYAAPTYGGCYIFDGNLTYQTTIGTYAGQQPIGVVYHPADNVVFFAWAGTTQVRAYDTTSWSLLNSYDFQHGFAAPGNWAFTQGRLRLSRDGTLLFATVNGGVRYVALTGYNRAPSAAPGNAAGPANQPLPLSLVASDPDGHPLTWTIVNAPTNGTLSGTAPNLVYTPNTGASGHDHFIFKVNDGKADSLPAKFDLTISSPPPSLSAIAPLEGGIEDTAFVVSYATLAAAANEFDVDGDPLAFRIESVLSGLLVKNGEPVVPGVTLLAAGQEIVWMPPAHAHGPVFPSFSVTVQDETANSGTPVPVVVNVASVNDLPVISPRFLDLAEDASGVLALTATDADNDPISYQIVTLPAHGAVIITAHILTYTPAPNYAGPDTLSYVAHDGQGESAAAPVAISVQGANDAPVFTQLAVLDGATEDVLYPITYEALLAASDAIDPDGEQIRFHVESILTGTTVKIRAVGSPSVNDLGPGEILGWTAPLNAHGPMAALLLRAVDASDASAPAVPLVINVASADDAATLDTISNVVVNEDTSVLAISLTGISTGAPGEANELSFSASSAATTLVPHPVVFYTNGQSTATLLLQPAANAFGTVNIEVTVSSDGVAQVTRGFTVQINPVNDAPSFATLLNRTMNAGTPSFIVPVDGITPGAPNETETVLLTAVSDNPTVLPNPTVSYSGGSHADLTLIPSATKAGIARVTVTANDGQLTFSRVFTVTVTPPNKLPTLNSINNLKIKPGIIDKSVNLSGISAGQNESQPLTVTAVSSNPTLVPHPIVIYTSPNTSGSLKISAPHATATGTSIITVTVNDGQTANQTVVRTFVVTVQR